jgi:MFS family permease
VLQKPETLKFTSGQVGLQASVYLIGAVLASMCFGYLTDRMGRKRLFDVTLGST